MDSRSKNRKKKFLGIKEVRLRPEDLKKVSYFHVYGFLTIASS